MSKARLTWCLWFIGCLAIWILSDSKAASYLTIASVLVPVILIILNQLVARRLELWLETAQTVEKEANLVVFIHARSGSRIPCPAVRCQVSCENILTGSRAYHDVYFSVNAGETGGASFSLSSIHCGKMQIRLERAECRDILGLTRCKSRIAKKKTAALVLPELYPADVVVGGSEVKDPEGVEYSLYRPGSDPSETFAIREYRPGDSLKQIHWKLSEKLGDTVIREPGFPISNSILILLDNRAPKQAKMPSASVRNSLGEALISISQNLIEKQISHSVGMMDWEEGTVKLYSVTDTDSLMTAMPALLAAKTQVDGVSISDRYDTQYGAMEFAHLVVLSSSPDESAKERPQGCVYTNLVCIDEKEEPEGGVVCFRDTEVAQALCYLEI